MSLGPGAALPLVIWGFAHGSVCLEAARRLALASARAPAPPPPEGTRVLVVRPCAGDEPRLRETLASLSAERGLALACALALAEPDDPARPAAEAAARALEAAGVPARVEVTHARGPNRKAAQLEVIAARADEAVLVFVDSDVLLAPGDVRALVAAAWAGALAWLPPVEAGRVATLGDALSQAVLASSLHAFPFLSRLDGRGLVGKCFAVRADVLARLGGLGGLSSHLGEDVELARRAAAAGVPVRALPRVVRSVAEGRSAPAVVARLTRWLVVVRLQRASLLASYPLLLAASPLLGLAALLPLGEPGDRAAAVAAAWLGRAALGAASAVLGARPAASLAAALPFVADAVLLLAWVRALAAREVVWRGRRIPLGELG